MVEAEGRTFSFEGVDSIAPDVLETFEYEYPGREIVIDIETDEFTAVCPFSGLPDFGTLRVRYTPDRRIIELKSFKYYLVSFRNVGIYQEHAVNRLLEDLAACCQPRWMEVVLDYRLRGGIHTVVRTEMGQRPTEVSTG
ncbi:MAG TPA: NADPH-dependent 7-cyano-7-deazaguanine reductase QueF [Acidobacteria bacterium]|nr:NADPH-dependent 7-cyano-7-deazaguanine reductase QueF [Acidobacteriota bacterium]